MSYENNMIFKINKIFPTVIFTDFKYTIKIWIINILMNNFSRFIHLYLLWIFPKYVGWNVVFLTELPEKSAHLLKILDNNFAWMAFDV